MFTHSIMRHVLWWWLILVVVVATAVGTLGPLEQRAWDWCRADPVVCGFLYRYDKEAGIVDAVAYYRAMNGSPPAWCPRWLERNVTTVEQLFAADSLLIGDALTRYRAVLNSAMGSCNDLYEVRGGNDVPSSPPFPRTPNWTRAPTRSSANAKPIRRAQRRPRAVRASAAAAPRVSIRAW